MVLNPIYEEDFLGFSYGFRHRRGAHDALDALAVVIDEFRRAFGGTPAEGDHGLGRLERMNCAVARQNHARHFVTDVRSNPYLQIKAGSYRHRGKCVACLSLPLSAPRLSWMVGIDVIDIAE
jgi:hypothetical protein